MVPGLLYRLSPGVAGGGAPRLLRRALAWVVLFACAPFGVPLVLAVVYYVVGNGLNDGAIALATLPVLLVFAPYLLANPERSRRLRRVFFLVLAADSAYAAWRIGQVEPDPDLALCVDGACGATAPWLARLVREDETAFAGMAISRPLGLLSDEEVEVAETSTRLVYADLATRRGGRPGPNGLFLTSTAERVTTLVSMPPGDGKVPGLVFLHGFGGLITPSLTALTTSELGERYAIVAPALDLAGYWWLSPGREVLVRTLDTLPPRVDRDRVWLVGLSNGAIGANELAADPTIGPRLRGTILLVGAGWLEFGDPVPTAPVLLVPGTEDVRFPLPSVQQAARVMERGGVEVTWDPVEAGHFAQFTHPEEVTSRVARWLGEQEQ